MLLRRVKDLIYYWEIDDRPRKQYSHVLRELKEDLRDNIDNLQLMKIYHIIPSYIKQDEIESCIKELKQYIQ